MRERTSNSYVTLLSYVFLLLTYYSPTPVSTCSNRFFPSFFPVSRKTMVLQGFARNKKKTSCVSSLRCATVGLRLYHSHTSWPQDNPVEVGNPFVAGALQQLTVLYVTKIQHFDSFFPIFGDLILKNGNHKISTMDLHQLSAQVHTNNVESVLYVRFTPRLICWKSKQDTRKYHIMII